MGKKLIGLDLGGTKLAAATFNLDGEMQHREYHPLHGRGGVEAGQFVLSVAEQLVRKVGDEGDEVVAIGLSVPGIAYVERGEVWAPNIPDWDPYPIAEHLRTLPGMEHMPLALDSDRSCHALGEYWQGTTQACDHSIFMAVGTGIGAGIIAHGQVLRGAGNIAGAIGWLALDRPYRQAYDPCGHYEYHASGSGLAKVAKELLSGDKNYAGPLSEASTLTAREIFEAYSSGDRVATAVIKQAIGYWGMAVANLVSIFNPDRFVFGGGIFGPACPLVDAIAEEARQWAQPISLQQVEFCCSALGRDAGLYGAGYLALEAANRHSDA